MDRLISEQAVIESIEFFQMNPQHFDFVNLIDDIKEIPSANPKTGHWIPVSERLPQSSGNYLITYCLQNKIETQEAVYVEDEDKWYDITDIEITLAVIAWMPLPKPYEPQERSKE